MAEAPKTAETRSFTVDPAILFSIINSQAGTLSKAMLEAVMNAIDAGATRCDITLTETSFVCKDNGRGFTSREEILSWFERFGTPHKEGDATFGKFRMGRGQMMAFATTKWQTGKFGMSVDIKNRGLDYDLSSLPKAVKGCTIEGTLYSPLNLYDLRSVLAELGDLVQYAQVPVYLNGKVISKNPSKLKWDVETDDAYIKTNSSNSMKVYNLGVLVRDYGSYKFGTGGVVVSKTALQVNFARNDVLEHSCEVWKRIKGHLSKESKKHVVKKASLNDDERAFLARCILAGDMPEGLNLAETRIITTATGTHVPLSSFLRASQVSVAPKDGDRLAERLHRAKIGFVVSPKTLDRFGVETLAELMVKFKAQLSHRGSWPEVVAFSAIAEGYTSRYTPVPDKDATPEELDALRLLRKANIVLSNFIDKNAEDERPPFQWREVFLGQSDAALAWTDGKTRVTIERKFLTRSARKGVDGWFQILMVMLHEYCHTGADLEGHDHPQEFYEMFEELSCASGNPVGSLSVASATVFASQQVEAGRTLSRQAAASVSHARDGEGRKVQVAAVAVLEQGTPPAAQLAIAAKVPKTSKAKKAKNVAKASGDNVQLSLFS
jgi:hypothetical protein